MMIEHLAFEITPEDQALWLEREAAVWSSYLASLPGFIRKEVWVDAARPERVDVVVWWADQASWHAVAADEVTRLDDLMGAWWRPATCTAMHLVNTTAPAASNDDVVALDPDVSGVPND